MSGKLVFTETLTKLGEAAFQGCGFLTSVNLRFSGLKEIAPSCFANCKILRTVSIPGSVQKIGNNAFYQCTSLEQVITSDSDKRISIGNKAFFNCYRFTTFSIEPIVTQIGEACFYGNKSLTYRPWLDVRNSGLKIGQSAFSFCNFRGLSFRPDIQLDVDSYAFSDCVELKSIDFSEYNDPENPPS
ncbi:MAG: leucine-rich repeat domain-containing protein [Mycoplasmoidaceae bacterium]|nr:leucine-rich repeat domain-containing protein [Mycoplasmoidaceae bacterium]